MTLTVEEYKRYLRYRNRLLDRMDDAKSFDEWDKLEREWRKVNSYLRGVMGFTHKKI